MDNNRFIGKLIISNIIGLVPNSYDDDDFNFLGCAHVTSRFLGINLTCQYFYVSKLK